MSTKEQHQAAEMQSYRCLIQEQAQQLYMIKQQNLSLKQQMKNLAQQHSNEIDRLNQRIRTINKQFLLEIEKTQKQRTIEEQLFILNKGRDVNVTRKKEEENILQKLSQEEDYATRQKRNVFNDRYFDSKQQGNNLKVVCKKNGDWHGFYYPQAFQIGKITRLEVRQVKTKDKSVMYGVCTDKVIGQDDPHGKFESRSYYADTGRVYEDRSHREGGPTIQDGSVLSIVADLIHWKLSWIRNNQVLAETMFTPQMKERKLYFLLCLYCKGDELEIIRSQ